MEINNGEGRGTEGPAWGQGPGEQPPFFGTLVCHCFVVSPANLWVL